MPQVLLEKEKTKEFVRNSQKNKKQKTKDKRQKIKKKKEIQIPRLYSIYRMRSWGQERRKRRKRGTGQLSALFFYQPSRQF